MSNGVPFDVAFEMDEAEVLAFVVAFGRVNGGQWDWGSMTWAKQK